MWYSKDAPKTLDYSKPILATSFETGANMLLMRQHRAIGGYDWFNLDDGSWNSSVHWKTPEEAVESYAPRYQIRNVKLTWEK